MAKDCVFCKIVQKKVPVKIEKETDSLIVFKDIHPKAPIHFLIVPKEHILDIRNAGDNLWVGIKEVAKAIVKEKEIKSFRLVTNASGAALIKHFHVHLLGQIGSDREI